MWSTWRWCTDLKLWNSYSFRCRARIVWSTQVNTSFVHFLFCYPFYFCFDHFVFLTKLHQLTFRFEFHSDRGSCFIRFHRPLYGRSNQTNQRCIIWSVAYRLYGNNRPWQWPTVWSKCRVPALLSGHQVASGKRSVWKFLFACNWVQPSEADFAGRRTVLGSSCSVAWYFIQFYQFMSWYNSVLSHKKMLFF